MSSVITRRLSTPLKRWLDRHLSQRVKRYILLISLWSYCNNKGDIDNDTLKKLNDTLSLATDERSLYIPALLAKVIWRDSLGNTNNELVFSSIEERKEFIHKTLDCIPAWLKYDRRDRIALDLDQLLIQSKIC